MVNKDRVTNRTDYISVSGTLATTANAGIAIVWLLAVSLRSIQFVIHSGGLMLPVVFPLDTT